MNDPMFSDEERQRLILAYLEGAGAKGATRAEIGDFVRWCEMAAVLFTMIELVMLGEVLPFKDGEGYRFTAKGVAN
jgi:hypothetical protein